MKRFRTFVAAALALLLALATGSPIYADYERSRAWYEAKPQEVREDIQGFLILLALYDGLVDGQFGPSTYRALTGFQGANGSARTGELAEAEIALLSERATEAMTSFGMELVEDSPARLSVMLPIGLAPNRMPTAQGTRYTSDRGDFRIDTFFHRLADRPMASIYQSAMSFHQRQITYSVLRPTYYVVSGRQGHRYVYEFGFGDASGTYGFQFSYLPAQAVAGGVTSIFAASYFTPLTTIETAGLPNSTIDLRPMAPAEPLDPNGLLDPYTPIEPAPLARPEVVPPPAPEREAARPASDNELELRQFGSFVVSPEMPHLLLLGGAIDINTPLDFRRALQAFPEVQTVALMSPGGFVASALIVAHEVHERRLNTVVWSDTECFSACSFIYFAGANRLALGSLGVHQVWAESADASDVQTTLSNLLEAMEAFDVDTRIITTMLRTHPDDMHVFTPEEVQAWSINRGAADLMAPATEDRQTNVDPEVLAGSQSLLLEAAEDGRSGATPFSGTVEWRRGTDEVGLPTLIGHADIPARNLSVTLTLRRNVDKQLPAPHLMDLDFRVPDAFAGGGISGLPGILLKNQELVQGTPLIGASARVAGNSFLFALSSAPNDVETNRTLLAERRWMDLAIIYSNGRRAIMTLEKDDGAMALFREFFGR